MTGLDPVIHAPSDYDVDARIKSAHDEFVIRQFERGIIVQIA